ncbi:magnesium ABC transporter ATPase [Rufibacter radiotolerans]|uniref:Magnesium-transporting ATPase, P-type 1 n=1 Tax=Rufibacter radiotolerans TaxID=1379910 RepID=A0A0H4VJI0_9BACT|nr:magnesium-translocating P-type ATPase [Rufibacter radiotolerans]AKQ45960.1 magnesium ABC transporter ATPase [Rufibacter radiotolerans]
MDLTTQSTFWQFEPPYWFGQLQSSGTGLTEQEALQRLQKAGVAIKRKPALQKDLLLFINQFRSPIILLLLGAVVLSAFLGDTSDVFIILLIVLSSSTLSFFQERKAGKVVERLQSMIALQSTVLRNGIAKEVLSTQIVPGDVILFNAGDLIPADCLLVEANELHANEASLTGESFPVRKETGRKEEQTPLAERRNCLWQGTSIVSGTGKALVVNTGTNTLFGTIVKSGATISESTFEKGIRDFGYFLMKITLVLSLVILVVNLLNHKSVVESALFALALAVGMAPELLPAITTIAMSAGAKRMLERNVIVKKLASIQNLGEVNLLCADKTGTVTEGTISVERLVDSTGQESDYVKTLAFWNASFETGYSNPIDEALKKMSMPATALPQKIGEIPYDFIRKRLSIAVDTGQEKLLISKGAYPQIVAICTTIRLNDHQVEPFAPHLEQVQKQFEKYGEDGLRAIALCYKNIPAEAVTKEAETEMTFVGFVLLKDPMKAGIVETILNLKKLYVDLKIITGDNKNIARSIGLGMGIAHPKIVTGPELLNISPEALEHKAAKTHIFAEVEPHQKERIILALRKSYTVAYLGDGINDVSAINAADVGISVSNAADITKEAADFVLLENNLSVLVDGIKEGRITFANTLKYIFISTGCTFGNMLSVAVASLFLPFLPMLPKQIILTNFITDIPYISITADNVDQEQIVKPGKWDLKLIRDYMVVFGLHSSLFDVVTFVTLLYLLKSTEGAFQTGWFIESILTELFILFIIRTYKNFFRSRPGKYLTLLSLVGLVLTLGLPYLPFAGSLGLVPLPLVNLGAMILIVLAYIITADLLKVWFFRRETHNLSRIR